MNDIGTISNPPDIDFDPASDLRPIVAHETGNRPLWIGLGLIGTAGLLLFVILETRRTTAMAPAVRLRAADFAAMPSAVAPMLYVPPEPIAVAPRAIASEPAVVRPTAMPVLVQQAPTTPVVQVRNEPISPMIGATDMLPQTPAPVPPPPADTSPAIILDLTAADADAVGTAASGSTTGSSTVTAARARASRLANRATVVPQGTLIAAVLETALDSSQPGQARALVSSDVANLRGNRVLIPRGSRLFGEYQGNIASGQSRAIIQWNRLVRPDGVAVAIDSPAADRLGRAGIRGRVNSHFLERLGGALLQSAIDVGTTIAGRAVYDSPVLVSVQGRTQSATTSLIGAPPQPTLTIRQGTRISVFVARDLDFTGVEGRR